MFAYGQRSNWIFFLERKAEDDASTTNVVENVIDEVEVESAEGGSDAVSSEGEKAPVAERMQVKMFTNFMTNKRFYSERPAAV